MNKKKKFVLILLISFITCAVVFILALMIGSYHIKLNELFGAIFTSNSEYSVQRKIIYTLRLPRTIVAGLTGIALSLSGLLYQETFQNELVSPDLLGVSNGAGVGAAFAIVLGLSTLYVSIFAFIIAIATVFITVLISKVFKNSTKTMLLLSGIIVSGFMSSLLSFVKYLSDTDTTLAQITYWLMGSFADSTMSKALVLSIIVISCSIVALLIKNRVNIIALGEAEAITKGVNYKAYRYIIIALSTLLTAASVAICGTISWVGLIIPHIVRITIGTKNTNKTIPLAMTFGCAFMIIVDILSRSFTHSEIPLSAVTGFFGTIIFVIILCAKKGGLRHND